MYALVRTSLAARQNVLVFCATKDGTRNLAAYVAQLLAADRRCLGDGGGDGSDAVADDELDERRVWLVKAVRRFDAEAAHQLQSCIGAQ